MKKITISLFLLYCGILQAQLSINNTLLTPSQLVQNVLVGQGVTPLNIKFNGTFADALLVKDQVGKFTTNFNPTNLGLNEGVIMTTGKAIGALGPNSVGNFTNPSATPVEGDADLALLSGKTIRTKAILEFDFYATGLVLNFDFVFGSDEYPEWVNTNFNDVFGFFLSGPGITGPYSNNSKNIALVPNTNIGVSIDNVNAGSNSNWFVTNTQQHVQYDGFTKPIRATSALQCGGLYHIKLAIANAGDNAYDSGVFLKNFSIPPMEIIDNYGLSANPNVCFGETITLDSGYATGTGFVFVWTLDGNIIAGNGPTLDVSVGGTYGLTVYTATACQLAHDEIIIAYRPPMPITSPQDINLCTTTPLPLTVNINQTAAMLGTQPASEYYVSYYNSSYSDAFYGVPTGVIPNSSLSNYTVNSVPTTVWARFEEVNGVACITVKPIVITNVIPTGTITYTPLTYCNTITTAQAITPSTLTPGGSYSATPAGLLINPSTGAITPYGSTPGTYQVDYIITGSCPYSTSASVIIEPCVCTVVATNSGPICSDATSFNLFASSAGAGYSYSWTGPNGFTSNVQNPTGVPLPTGTPPFIYEVTATLGVDTCVGQTTLVVNALPSITGTPTVCVNSTTQLTGSASPATTTPWTSSNTAVATVDSTGLVTGITSGTTTITYTNSNGCIITQVVTVNALPTITGNTAICQGLTTQLTGSATPATTTPWTSSNTAVATVDSTGLVTGITAGTTTITYTNTNGCTITQVVTINALPSITGTPTVCVNSTTQLTGSATPASTSPWTSSNTAIASVDSTGLVTGVAAGTTTITYTNSNGCLITQVVTVNTLPTITGNATICQGLTTQLTGSATPATTTPWTSSNTAVATVDSTGLVTGITAGTTTITYTNSNGCIATQVVTVNGTPTITGTFSVCEGLSTQLTGSATPSGTTPWTSSNTAIATVDSTGLVSALTIGTTTITYTNTNGCAITEVITVNGTPTITGTFTVCEGLSTQLTGSASPATTTPWTSSNTAVATVDSTGLVTGITSGTTTITYTNSNGCIITQVVTVNALPTITGNTAICQGLTTQLTGSATPATTTPWTSSNTAVATVDSTGLVTGITAGTTTITYTNTNGCTITQVVTINALPSITGTPTVCVNSTTQLTGSATPASTSPWTSSNTAIASVDSTGLVTGVAAGTTTITYTNSNGCLITQVVTVNTLPTITGNATICQGLTTQLTGSATPASTTPWTSSNTAVASVDSTGLVTGITAGTTTITYTNSNGCIATQVVTVNGTPTITGTFSVCEGLSTQLTGSATPSGTTPWTSSNTAIATVDSTGLVSALTIGTTTITYTNTNGCIVTQVVTINALPSITGTPTVCVNSTTQLTGSATPASTSPWTSSNTAIASVDSTGLVTGVAAGTTTITYTNSNGCIITQVVTVNALPTITGNTAICQGLTTQLTGSATPATTTPWTSSNTAVATVDSTGLVTGITAGTTTITYTNTNGCAITEVITVNGTPTITGTFTVCEGLSTQLTGSASPATTTPWTSSNTAVATVDSTGLVTGITSGTTTITYTNSNGCLITQVVTVNTLPTITGNATICQGLTTLLTGSATPASTTPWTSSNTAVATVDSTGLVTGITAGTTTITYTNSNGCIATQVVTVNGTPTITGTFSVCEGLSTQLTGSATPSGTTPWTSSNTAIATVDSTGLVSALAIGTTTITYTNTNGCIVTQVVTINALPSITGTPTVCVNSTTQLTGSATPASTSPWTSSNTAIASVDSTGLVTGVAAGTTTITYTNSNGCIITQVVTVNALPTITGNTAICQGLTTQLTGSATPATTTPWTSSNTAVATVDSTGLVTGITAGTTTITYTNTNGCAITEVITVNGTPTITGTFTVCEGLSTQLTGSASPATTTPWTSSNTAVATVDSTGLVTGITSGTTTITYTNSNGCLITQVVTVNTLPTITGNATICQGLTTQLTGSATPATTTPWTSSNTAVATVDSTGLVTGITAGTTTITYTNSNGCITTTVVLVKSPPTVAVNSPIACLGATVTLTATSGLPGTYSYAWTVPPGAVPPGDVVSFTTSVAGTYSVILTDTVTTCSSTSASGIVTLNAIPLAVATPLGQTVCSGQTTGISLSSSVVGTVFNWTAVQVDATGATSDTGSIISQPLTATGLVPATVTYTVIPTANGCAGPATVVTITVMPTPVATATPVVQTICSGGTTAIALTSNLALPTFNWNVIQTGATGASAGSGSTINQVLSAIGNSVGEAVYSITPIVSGCPGTPITVSITVNPIPVITASPATATICSGATTNISLSSTLSGTIYNWSVIQTGVLGALPGSGSSISQTLTTVGILPGSAQYTITPITGGCVGLPITVTITVNPTPELFAFATAGICSGESPNITLSPNLPATTFAWTAVQTGVSGALDGVGASIDQVLTTTGTNPGTVVYTVTPSANSCTGTSVAITVTVDPLPLPAIQPGVICVEQSTGIAFQTYVLNTQLSGSTHTFVWYLDGVIVPGASGSSYEALEAGSYSVIATNNTTGCVSLPLSVTVSETFPGQGITTTQTLAFADNAEVTVDVIGTGVYEYQLDNGMFQSSNIFTNVGIGPHTIWVRDTDGCTDLTTTIYIIGYPHYFTPNGDGVHDQWNIIGLSNQPNAKIYIFDRYGKLIKQISPTSQGWDGTRNGEPLPATDYWFTVDYFEAGTDKVFKSHFSLKR